MRVVHVKAYDAWLIKYVTDGGVQLYVCRDMSVNRMEWAARFKSEQEANDFAQKAAEARAEVTESI